SSATLVLAMLNLPLLMLRQLHQIFSTKIQPLYSYWKLAIALVLLVLCTSCFSPKPSDVSLDLKVQPANRSGTYNVIGTTNLPDRSRIAVSAIRYLFPTEEQSLAPDPNATYSILDRQITEVAKGKWQVTLNLWQVAPDGRLQEAWQLNQAQTELSLNPSPEVSFVAIFDPSAQRLQSQQQGLQAEDLRGSLVRFTTEGQSYVKASQTLPIVLPVESERRPPPKLEAEDINYGWGNRYEIEPEPSVAKTMPPQPLKTDQTNSPLSPSEFLR
ncbi:MAG TPA: hypothetical protein V6C91_12625, partial [Coleofasciculaceae cyanobacterium]